jgi:hypothetical protein
VPANEQDRLSRAGNKTGHTTELQSRNRKPLAKTHLRCRIPKICQPGEAALIRGRIEISKVNLTDEGPKLLKIKTDFFPQA